MRALLCSINYAPDLTGIGKYTREMAEWLAARGLEVTVDFDEEQFFAMGNLGLVFHF